MLAMDYGFYKVMSPLTRRLVTQPTKKLSFAVPCTGTSGDRSALHPSSMRASKRELGDVEWDVSNEFRIAAQYRF